MPEVPASLPEAVPVAARSSPVPPECVPYIWQAVHTLQNSFGMYHEYPSVLTHNPDDVLTLENLSDTTPPQVITDAPVQTNACLSMIVDNSQTPTSPSYAPFANSTVFGLMNWMWSGSAIKSIREMVKLVNFLKSDNFKKEDLVDFDVCKQTAQFDASLEDTTRSASECSGVQCSKEGAHSVVKDRWHEVEVDIQVPTRQAHSSANDIPVFSVPGLHHQSLVEVLKAVCEDYASYCFHYAPFKQFWKPTTDSEPQCIYDEIYSSDAMVEAHEAVQNLPAKPGCPLEWVVAALMF